ncbi:MAG: tripartite tricarboxylate transporter TctB family protein [Alphaproteobacteria bacterium]|nr:tripartite tricarboxylate transporter TctB family protein [Alphaproteobacteria bacterium]
MAETQPNQPLPLLPHEEPLPPRVDLWIAVVFFAVGAAIVAVAAQMPTYKEQQGEIYNWPGLVPTVHGAIVALLSAWLAIRSIGRGALLPGAQGLPARREGYSNGRLAVAAGLCLVFTTLLIGRLPFWLAAALFVASFITLFEWRRDVPPAANLRRLVIAAAIGVGTGIGVVLVFERLFLVRLP